ncbi:MAG: cobalt ECF transporter T component CbiQ [Candidatus Parabeggiatoa sp. nov. 1]|nr:MAG: cobalt ECF transporter T component CbiQ [Gammaproteobacteria bacterium]
MSAGLDISKVLDSEKQLLADKGSGCFLWDARLKIGLLIVVIVLNVGLAINTLSAILLFIGLSIVLWSRPPLGRTVLFFIAPFVPTLIAAVGIAITTGITPVIKIWVFTVYEEGLIHSLGVILRVYCDITWLVLTFITTPFNTILKALRWYYMPAILVDTLALMYRYSFLLYEEFTRMNTAAISRGGRNGQWNTIKTLSRITAQVFMRTYDRSEKIFHAMVARGGEKIDAGH